MGASCSPGRWSSSASSSPRSRSSPATCGGRCSTRTRSRTPRQSFSRASRSALQVAGTLVDQLYANVDVQAELEAQLPADQKGLAAPLAGALRSLGERTAYQLLGRPRVQALFVAAAVNARQQADDALSDDLGPLETQNGVIVLNLHDAVIELGSQLSFLGELEGRIPEDAGVIEIVRADRFETAQELTSLFRSAAFVLPFIALALVAAGIALARGRRRIELRAFAVGAILGGVLILVRAQPRRRRSGRQAVDLDRCRARGEGRVGDADPASRRRRLDGHHPRDRRPRRRLALGSHGLGCNRPARAWHRCSRDVALGYSVVFGGYLLLLLWEPTAQFGRLLTIVVFAILLAVGYEALRRLVIAEEPDAAEASVGDRLRSLRPGGEKASPAGADLASQLAEITRLHETGVLDDATFTAAKARLLR